MPADAELSALHFLPSTHVKLIDFVFQMPKMLYKF